MLWLLFYYDRIQEISQNTVGKKLHDKVLLDLKWGQVSVYDLLQLLETLKMIQSTLNDLSFNVSYFRAANIVFVKNKCFAF